MRFEYAGGVLDHERRTITEFEGSVLPYLERHGSMIGEMAMANDNDAFKVIKHYRAFVEGDPTWREHNLRMLVSALKILERKIQ